MKKTSVRPADDIERVLDLYGDSLFRLCVVMLGNESDAEDAVQETIIRYFQNSPVFNDDEHEKAWLIKVATNRCRDMIRFRSRHPQTDIENLYDLVAGEHDGRIIDALMALPERFRLVMMLYYVEGYRTDEIAQIIGKTRSAVKMRLKKGRELLEKNYRKEYL